MAGKKGRYETKRKGKKGSIFFVLLLVCVLAAAVFFLLSNRQEDTAGVTKPTGIATEPAAFEMQAEDHYAPVLEKYRRAISEGWTMEQCELEGISTRFYIPEGSDFTIGYRIVDINRDGRPELLIGHSSNIWDLYTTLEDGTPVQLLSDAQDGWQYYVSEDGLIAAEYYSKEDCYVEYYRLEGYELVMERQLQYQDGQWMIETSRQEWKNISEGEVSSITGSFDYMEPEWIPLDPDALKTDPDTIERYIPVLEKYKTAVSEQWTKEQCVQNDISSYISTPSSELGWCLMDLDENGIQELIISDGHSIFDLYTLHDNQVKHVLTDQDDHTFKLCENGIIEKQVFFSQASRWYFYEFSADEQILQGVLIYDSQKENDKVYAYGPNEDNVSYISKEEAGSIIFAHQPAKLKVTPFVEGQFGNATDLMAYDSLLALYRQALAEKWDMQQCSDNDISLMISNFAEDPDRISAYLLDLDGDDVAELIITDGMMIYDLYTLKSGTPVKLLTGWERNSYRLCLNNVIHNQGSNGAASTVFNYYQLTAGELMLVESVVFDANKDFENPWFRSSDGETPEVSITEEEAKWIMDSYPSISFLGIDLLEMQ